MCECWCRSMSDYYYIQRIPLLLFVLPGVLTNNPTAKPVDGHRRGHRS